MAVIYSLEGVFYEVIRNPSRPISSLGFDPSSEAGAHLIANRLRLHWLKQGIDMPVSVTCTVPARANGEKDKRPPVYSASLVTAERRRVTELEADKIRRAIEAEVRTWVEWCSKRVA